MRIFLFEDSTTTLIVSVVALWISTVLVFFVCTNLGWYYSVSVLAWVHIILRRYQSGSLPIWVRTNTGRYQSGSIDGLTKLHASSSNKQQLTAEKSGNLINSFHAQEM